MSEQVECRNCGADIDEDDQIDCLGCGQWGCHHCMPSGVCHDCECEEE